MKWIQIYTHAEVADIERGPRQTMFCYYCGDSLPVVYPGSYSAHQFEQQHGAHPPQMLLRFESKLP